MPKDRKFRITFTFVDEGLPENASLNRALEKEYEEILTNDLYEHDIVYVEIEKMEEIQ